MATESGYSNQKKLGEAQFKTIHNLGSDRFGTAVSTKALSEITATAIAISGVLVDEDTRYLYLEIPTHGAREKDVIRLVSGDLSAYEFEVLEVVDANSVKVLNIALPEVGDTAKTMRWVTSKADSEGNLNFSPGPTTFVKNSVTTIVNQDTAVPANNRALPSQMVIIKDGIQVPILKDTATPANTVPVPVEIVAAGGTEINITAGDINVQMTDLGVNFDSLRIGDGSGVYAGITGTGRMLVSDTGVAALLSQIDSKVDDLATSAHQVTAQTSLTSIDSKVTGVSTAAHQVTAQTSLTSIDGKLSDVATETKQDALIAKLPSTIGQKTAADSLSVVLASGTALAVSSTTLATEAKQDTQITELQQIEADIEAVVAKLPSTIGQKLPADSLSVVLATGYSLTATVTGGATEAKQDSQITELQEIEADIESMSAKLPATLGQKAMAASLAVVLPSDQTVGVSVGALTPTYQEILNLTTVAQTFTAPAGAKWAKVQADDTNSANIRVKIGGTATVSSGMQFQAGRSEDYQAVGNISVIAESGSGQKIYVQFGA